MAAFRLDQVDSHRQPIERRMGNQNRLARFRLRLGQLSFV